MCRGALLNTTRRVLVTLLCLPAAACAGPATGDVASTPPGRIATSSAGMVVSGSAPATLAGVEMLALGGNAVDAAVATAFALAVTEPTQSGLGGRTQAVVWRPDGPPFGIDATNEVPAGYDPDTAPQVDDGYGVIATPGTVAALTRLHARAGSLPFAAVVGPAIALAEGGFALSAGEANRLSEIRDRLLLSSPAAAVFLRSDGSAFAPGDTLRQPDLARVLRAVVEGGAEVFYRGWIAERIADDIGRAGGHVTLADLAAFEAEDAIVVEGRYGSLELVGTYLPASGATVIEALQILDRMGVSDADADRRAFAIGQALTQAFDDRDTAWNDERAPEDDALWITSVALAEQRARELGSPSAVGAGPDRSESPNTTHLSVVDRDGMAVAMTQSLGPTGGSRVATEGLGFLYAASLGGYLGYVEPGDRPWSSQAPLIALRNGSPAYVLGGAGARRIVSALVHAVVRLESEGATLDEALSAPRLHPAGSAWRFEWPAGAGGTPPGSALAAAAGHEVLVLPMDDYFARLNVIAVDPVTGVLTGVADPRWAWGASAGPVDGR